MSKKENREIEILRKQLELLAEKSAVISKLSGHESELVNYSHAMCEIVALIHQDDDKHVRFYKSRYRT